MFIGLHHAGLPTADMARAKTFWCGILGFVEFPEKTNWLGWDGTTYPVHLMPEHGPTTRDGLSRHIALEVERLESILAVLLEAGLSPFQADLKGERRAILGRDQPLDFGIGTIFVYDPDGNLVEFVEKNRGIFALLK